MFNPDGCFCCLPPEDPCTTSNCTFLSNEMSDFEINPYWTQVTGAGAVGNGSYTVTNAQDLDVGNDAPCRRVTVETTLATTSADSVYIVCWKKSSSHNPSTQCPVTSLTFCVESKRVSESDGQVRFFIKQNGSTYVTKTGFSIGINWKRATGTFSQSDFEELSSGAQPNFTATGTAIEFGFGLKIPVNSGDEPFSDVWFDNLCVVVAKNCPTETCASGPCDFLDTGSASLTSVSTAGNGAYLGTSGIGNPGPSHKFFTRQAGDHAYARMSQSVASISSALPCVRPASMSVCIDSLKDGLGTAIPCIGLASSSSVVSVTCHTWTRTDWGTLTATVAIPASANLSDLYVMVGVRNQGASSDTTTYIDNICVKAICDTSGCVISQPSQCSNDMEVSFSAPPFPSVFGPHSATLTYFNSVFAGGVVVTRPPSGPEATSNPAIWEFTDFGPSPSFPGTDYGIRIQVSPVTSGGTCKFRILTLAYDRRPAGSQAFLAGTYINWQSGTITDCDAPFTGGLPAIGRADWFVMSTSCIPTVTPII